MGNRIIEGIQRRIANKHIEEIQRKIANGQFPLIPAPETIRHAELGEFRLELDLDCFTASFMKKLTSLRWYRKAAKSVNNLERKIGGRIDSPLRGKYNHELVDLEARVQHLLLDELKTDNSPGGRFLAELAVCDNKQARKAFYKYYAGLNYESRAYIGKRVPTERYEKVVERCVLLATQDEFLKDLFGKYCEIAKHSTLQMLPPAQRDLREAEGKLEKFRKAVGNPQSTADIGQRLEAAKTEITAPAAKKMPAKRVPVEKKPGIKIELPGWMKRWFKI